MVGQSGVRSGRRFRKGGAVDGMVRRVALMRVDTAVMGKKRRCDYFEAIPVRLSRLQMQRLLGVCKRL